MKEYEKGNAASLFRKVVIFDNVATLECQIAKFKRERELVIALSGITVNAELIHKQLVLQYI